MANLNLRDRDAIQSAEGIIFRVFGYSHPANAYLCDAEYASSKIFNSTDPRAPREGRSELYYKFYNDEGMKLVTKKYPQYLVNHEMLGLKTRRCPTEPHCRSTPATAPTSGTAQKRAQQTRFWRP